MNTLEGYKHSLMDQFRYYALKIVSLNCKIIFLTACLQLNLVPKGFQLKFPIYSFPPQLRDEVKIFATQSSFQLTNMAIQLYKKLSKEYADKLLLVYQELFNTPDLVLNINIMLSDLEIFMNNKMKTLHKKLYYLIQSNSSSSGYYNTNNVQVTFDLSTNSNINTANNSDSYQNNHNIGLFTTVEQNETNDLASNVVNLSKHLLTNDEASVLSKGLTFAPTPEFNHMDFVADALTFARNVRLKFYFSQNGLSSNKDIPNSVKKFQPHSDWNPPNLPPDHPIEQFLNVILANVAQSSFAESLHKKDNLTLGERKSIKSLKQNKNIIILPADKGNSIVILDIEDYISEIEKQLGDGKFYQVIKEDPTYKFHKQIKKYLLKEGPKEGINSSTLNLLVPETPRTPLFYVLPKIHKPCRPPPGRPIVSGYGSPTERISSYIDDLLQPFVKELDSYVKNTDHFIKRLNEIRQPVPNDIILVTIDVQSLYTNIPHQEGKLSVASFLNSRAHNSKPSTPFIINLINMILTMNNFKFRDKNYLQINGTAMGTRMAPAYANLFMGKLEKDFLESQPHKPLTWLRFIDDIFMIWQHGNVLLEKFLENLNKFSVLKFTWNCSSSIITFLDIDVYTKSGFLKTKIHIKENNTMDYLHYNSCHPIHIKKSVPKSLSIRAKQLCSDNSDYLDYIDKLSKAFIARKYPDKTINDQIRKSKSTVRTTKNYKDDPKFITKYFPGLYKTNNILRTAYNILETSPLTQNLFSKAPRLIFSKAPNLRNLLVRPKLLPTQIPSSDTKTNSLGCHACNDKRCATCKILNPAATFISSTTNKTYPITNHIDCKSKNVIYQLSCKFCPKDYVGLTTNPLHIRMNNHRSSSNRQDEKLVSQHALAHGKIFNDCYTLKGICKVPEGSSKTRLDSLEQAHQWVLKSKLPFGLNKR